MSPTIDIPKLATRLNSICEEQPFITRFMFVDLQNGWPIERFGNEPTPSASTRKTSIMMAVLGAVAAGRLNLDEKITYEPRHAHDVASGMLRYFTPGLTISLQDAIVGMMVLSDNVCTNMVFERVTLKEVADYCGRIGLAHTHHRFLIPPSNLPADHGLDNVTVTTAADQAKLLQLILNGAASDFEAGKLECTQDLCSFALQTLKDQVHRYGLRSRLPFEAIVAGKSGTGKRGRMDVGIIYKEERPVCVLTVYTDQVPHVMPDGTPGYTIALETIGKLAQASWEAF